MIENDSKPTIHIEPSNPEVQIVKLERDLSGTPPDDVLMSYLAQISKIPMLEREEEQRLFRLLRESVTFSGGISDLKIEYTQPWGEETWVKLINANLRFPVWMARIYEGLGVDLLDNIQQGNMGLMVAASRFDPERKSKFITYASFWVRQAILKNIYYHGRMIRIPVLKNNMEMQRMKKAINDWNQVNEGEPSFWGIADTLDVHVNEVNRMVTDVKDIVSLDEPVGDNDAVFGDTIEDKNNEDIDNVVTERERREIVVKILSSIKDERHRLIIQMRYGFIDGKVFTLEEIGKELRISKQRVEQIMKKILNELRFSTSREEISDYLD